MILICPSCSTRYLVDALSIGETGRTVRCARCNRSWFQPPAPKQSFETFESRSDEPPVLRKPQRVRPIPKGSNLPALPGSVRPRRPWLGWAILALVIVGIGIAGLLLRKEIVASWPPSSRLYAWTDQVVGDGQGSAESEAFRLNIRNLQSERGREAGKPILLVSGEVVNDGSTERDLPRLRVALTDASGAEIYHWTVTLAKDAIAPGGAIPFSTQLPDPPENATSLSVRFLADH